MLRLAARGAARALATARPAVKQLTPMDGNEAAARAAYHMSNAIFLFPITPSSQMGELCDAWANAGVRNAFGEVPVVRQMQSEAGAAGAIHGSCVSGALATSFTASQGLLLYVPTMLKMAGELQPHVLHVAARYISMANLSIYGDHTDVMATRHTGYAIAMSGSVQEVADMAVASHAATLLSRVPVLHAFEGFRLSHELSSIEAVPPSVMEALLPREAVAAHRARALLPEHPYSLGGGAGPDTTWPISEAANRYHAAVPGIFQGALNRLAEHTGRHYRLFEYSGAPDADRVIVVMGAAGTVCEETATHLNAKGERVGVLKVRLYRPWDAAGLLSALPHTARAVAVLDRTKEHGSLGEPLFLDVATTVALAGDERAGLRVVGGRYGIAGREFQPQHALAVFDNLAAAVPRTAFTVGIVDDVTNSSLPVGPPLKTLDPSTKQAMVWGLGSDGSVSANKLAVQMVVAGGGKHAQAAFSYSADKSLAVTRSMLRFSDKPITSHYAVSTADFVSISTPSFLRRYPVLDSAAHGATVLLNVPWTTAEELEANMPAALRRTAAERGLRLFACDASAIAVRHGLRGRYSQAMNALFFHLTGVLGGDWMPQLEAQIAREFRRLGQKVVDANIAVARDAISGLTEIKYDTAAWAAAGDAPADAGAALEAPPPYVTRIVVPALGMRAGGLKVSDFAANVGGVQPTQLSQFEKKGVAELLPVWDASTCTQCNECAYVCPHAAIRPFLLAPGEAEAAEAKFGGGDAFVSLKLRSAGLDKETRANLKDFKYKLAVSPLDCTGCTLCEAICASDSLSMAPATDAARGGAAAAEWRWLTSQLPERDPLLSDAAKATVRMSQHKFNLFEYPAACQGCTEAQVFKALTTTFGRRLVMQGVSGCSSVFSGMFARSPFRIAADGRGPVYARSLFENGAEVAVGFHVSLHSRRAALGERVSALLSAPDRGGLPPAAAEALSAWLAAYSDGDRSLALLPTLDSALDGVDKSGPLGWLRTPETRDLWVKKSVWAIGGDGWANDIGFGGLDHAVAGGDDLNILVLDNEVYANTGGQVSKATPRSAVAKFAAHGRRAAKKDLPLMMTTYDNVYVANVALPNAKSFRRFLEVLREAETFPGPSLVNVFVNCSAHKAGAPGLGLEVQELAVSSGYWPLWTWDPRRRAAGEAPMRLESGAPDASALPTFLARQGRFNTLKHTNPELGVDAMWADLANDVRRRWAHLKHLAAMRPEGAQ